MDITTTDQNKPKTLAELKTGDKVAIRMSDGERFVHLISTVENDTPRVLVVRGSRYRRSDGANIESQWALNCLTPVTTKIVAECEKYDLFKLCESQMSPNLSHDQLTRIAAILGEGKP